MLAIIFFWRQKPTRTELIFIECLKIFSFLTLLCYSFFILFIVFTHFVFERNVIGFGLSKQVYTCSRSIRILLPVFFSLMKEFGILFGSSYIYIFALVITDLVLSWGVVSQVINQLRYRMQECGIEIGVRSWLNWVNGDLTEI